MDYPRDKVILYQGWKGAYAPSLGHFNVKLETYLKMAKIPYEVGHVGITETNACRVNEQFYSR